MEPITEGTRVRSADYGDGVVLAVGPRTEIDWDDEDHPLRHDASFVDTLERLES